MKKSLFAPIIALSWIACGPSEKPAGPDAGPDTSCGIDCAAQERYGLIINRCFEYSSSMQAASPPDLGVLVVEKETLEGGLDTLPVQYRESGQIRQTDFFSFKDGALILARRSFPNGHSVTYKDSSGDIVGVKWHDAANATGTLESEVSADVIAGSRQSVPTSYKVTRVQATSSELAVPLKTYDTADKLLILEAPDNGSDPRRVFVEGTGFILFSTYFNLFPGGTAQEYRLQAVRDIEPGDAECGFDTP